MKPVFLKNKAETAFSKSTKKGIIICISEKGFSTAMTADFPYSVAFAVQYNQTESCTESEFQEKYESAMENLKSSNNS